MTTNQTRLFAAIDGTWPAAALVEAGPWILREGRGGGQRVSAATAQHEWREDDLAAAEKAMCLMGQTPLFMIRPGEHRLDAMLAAQGYERRDPTNIWVSPIDPLCDRKIPPVTAFTVWEPLAIMHEIWESGGIGSARQRVMERVTVPKTGLFGRVSDKPGGTGFCAVHNGTAMIHALHILPHQRQKGLARWMVRAAALWARSKGAHRLSLLTVETNTASNALCASLGFRNVGQYHYRRLPDQDSEDT